jgi:rRNA maturation endonuclease Nob1
VDCDARFSTDHDYCPECGADAVVETTDEAEYSRI